MTCSIKVKRLDIVSQKIHRENIVVTCRLVVLERGVKGKRTRDTRHLRSLNEEKETAAIISHAIVQ